MTGFLTRGEALRIGLTYGLLVLETICNLALPALAGIAIDSVIAGKTSGLHLLIAGILALVLSGALRKTYDTRIFGRIQTRLALAIGAQGIAPSQKIARVRLIDDLGQFFDTYLPQAIGGFISSLGAAGVLFLYDASVASAAIAAGLGIAVFAGFVSRRTAALNARINRRIESEAAVLQLRPSRALGRHLEVLRRLRNARSDAETLIFAGGWIAITGLLAFSILHAAGSSSTAGHVFAVVSYVLAIAEGFDKLPPMIERLTRARDVVARIRRGGLGGTG